MVVYGCKIQKADVLGCVVRQLERAIGCVSSQRTVLVMEETMLLIQSAENALEK